MKEPRNHLSRDLQALRYLDALNAGDLRTVSALWEEASHDPELEQMLSSLDGAMFPEIPANRSSLPARRGGRRRPWAIWVGAAGTLAAACLLAILAWPPRDTEKQSSKPLARETGTELPHRSSDVSRNLTPLLAARRDLDDTAMPGFVWPLENLLSASTPLDLLE